MDKFNDFPAFRKLNNDLRIYKIIDTKSFLEKQRMGTKVFEFNIQAKQYPEILRIQDMLACNGFVLASEYEWLNF